MQPQAPSAPVTRLVPVSPCSLPAGFGFLVALVSRAAVADPILWIFKAGKSSFHGCPRGWGAALLRRGGDI